MNEFHILEWNMGYKTMYMTSPCFHIFYTLDYICYGIYMTNRHLPNL